MQMFLTTQQHPDVQPFDGGLLDCWPAYAIDALTIARAELQRIRIHLKREVTP